MYFFVFGSRQQESFISLTLKTLRNILVITFGDSHRPLRVGSSYVGFFSPVDSMLYGKCIQLLYTGIISLCSLASLISMLDIKCI
jgi:hypothetical protein